MPDDQTTRKLQHREIRVGALFPADQQTSITIEPAVRAFDDPAPRPRAFSIGLALIASSSSSPSCQKRSKTPASVHSRNRRCADECEHKTVASSAAHCIPVRSNSRIASMATRSGMRGRWQPSGWGLGGGSTAPSVPTSHRSCASRHHVANSSPCPPNRKSRSLDKQERSYFNLPRQALKIHTD